MRTRTLHASAAVIVGGLALAGLLHRREFSEPLPAMGHDPPYEGARQRGTRPVKRAVGPRFTTSAPAHGQGAPAIEDTDDPRLVELRDATVKLETDCVAQGGCDPRELLVQQAGLAFDYGLGPEHPRREQLLEVVGWSYDERQHLSELFTGKQIDRRQLFARLTQHFGEMSRRMGELLDDAEYEGMFQTKKGVNPSRLLGLSAQRADKIDTEIVSLERSEAAQLPPWQEPGAGAR